MLQISDDAVALVREKNTPIFIDRAQNVEACCFELSFPPAVRFGRPKRPTGYLSRVIQGVEVHIPSCFPLSRPLTIRVSQFLGLKRLVIAGWRPA